MGRPVLVRASDERGVTLVELLVTMALLAVLGVATIGSLLSVQRVTAGATQRNDDLAVARTAMDRMEQLLRTATVPMTGTADVEVFTPLSVRFYAALVSRTPPSGTPPGPRLVELALSDPAVNSRRTLTETITIPRAVSGGWAWTGTGTTTVTRVLATDVWDDDGDATTEPLFATVCEPEATPCAVTDMRAVDLGLALRRPGGAAVTPTVLESRVRLVNRGLG